MKKNKRIAAKFNYHFTAADLNKYLQKKNKMKYVNVIKYTDHLNNCVDCWSLWNRVRWEAAKEKEGYQELQNYLGKNFKEHFDSSWAIAEDWKKVNPKSDKEVADFYKHNQHYLYNLIIWFCSGDRYNYKDDIDKLVTKFKIRSVIDYGCGVGNDGLLMVEKGLKVYFVDFKCPSIDFLKWRCKKRGISQSILDVENLRKLPKADMFWAIDVLEHIPNPLEVIDLLAEQTRVFVHCSRFGDNHGGRHPCHFDFDEIRLNNVLRAKGYKHIPWSGLSVWVKRSIS